MSPVHISIDSHLTKVKRYEKLSNGVVKNLEALAEIFALDIFSGIESKPKS